MDIVHWTLDANKGEVQLLLWRDEGDRLCAAWVARKLIVRVRSSRLPLHWLRLPAGNSVIGFKDNSSAIRGGPVTPLLPKTPGGTSALEPQARAVLWLLLHAALQLPCILGSLPR